jgi:hypothetical protein
VRSPSTLKSKYLNSQIKVASRHPKNARKAHKRSKCTRRRFETSESSKATVHDTLLIITVSSRKKMVGIVLFEFSKKKTQKKERKKNETKPQIFKIQKREFSQKKKKLTKKIQNKLPDP